MFQQELRGLIWVTLPDLEFLIRALQLRSRWIRELVRHNRRWSRRFPLRRVSRPANGLGARLAKLLLSDA